MAPSAVPEPLVGQTQNASHNAGVSFLGDLPEISSQCGPSTHISRSKSNEQTVTVDDDGLVDVLGTTTFNDAPEAEMGYFGP